jgi:N-acetylglucosamine-6-phosphate deacetylase
MNRIFIKNGKLVLPDKIKEKAVLVIENGKIAQTDYKGEIPEGAEIIDANEGVVLAGFIDEHLHGGGGFDFMDASKEAFREIRKIHCLYGTTSITPTTVTDSIEHTEHLFDIYREVAKEDKYANFLGIHLEGPFLSKEMKGAQQEKYLQEPNKIVVERLLKSGGDIIKRISCAPELNGIKQMTNMLLEAGIRLSIAHSNATCRQVIEAYKWGFDQITHLYSNTPSVRKIGQKVEAGIVEAAYLLTDMRVELIGDGVHVPKELLQLVIKLKGADKVLLITDAMRAAGTKVKESILGGLQGGHKVIIEDGVAKLPDRSFFAGSIATSDLVFRNAVQNAGIPITMVSEMMSLTPAKSLGVDKEKGSLESGKDADIVIMDKELKVSHVFVGGKKVF